MPGLMLKHVSKRGPSQLKEQLIIVSHPAVCEYENTGTRCLSDGHDVIAEQSFSEVSYGIHTSITVIFNGFSRTYYQNDLSFIVKPMSAEMW